MKLRETSQTPDRESLVQRLETLEAKLSAALERIVAMEEESTRLRREKSQLREENERLHLLESEADKLILTLVRDLYSGRHEPLKVIIMLDLYETLEKIIDRCRDAGHVIFQIVLKYS